MFNNDLARFDWIVLDWLLRLHKPSGQGVKTIDIALYVTKNPRTIRGALAKLTRLEMVERVGQRRGWLPTPEGIDLLSAKRKMDAPAHAKTSNVWQPRLRLTSYSNLN